MPASSKWYFFLIHVLSDQSSVCTSNLPPIRATCPAHLIFLDLIFYFVKSINYKAPISCQFLPLRSKYCLQHPALKHCPRLMYATELHLKVTIDV